MPKLDIFVSITHKRSVRIYKDVNLLGKGQRGSQAGLVTS
jgi:hypothetical protein